MAYLLKKYLSLEEVYLNNFFNKLNKNESELIKKSKKKEFVNPKVY